MADGKDLGKITSVNNYELKKTAKAARQKLLRSGIIITELHKNPGEEPREIEVGDWIIEEHTIGTFSSEDIGMVEFMYDEEGNVVTIDTDGNMTDNNIVVDLNTYPNIFEKKDNPDFHDIHEYRDYGVADQIVFLYAWASTKLKMKLEKRIRDILRGD